MRTLVLVRHAATTATRAGAFPVDEPVEEPSLPAIRRLPGRLPAAADVVTSPALRCRQTASEAGYQADVDEAIGPCDFGAWAGRTLTEVAAGDPKSTQAWMTDAEASPHGGESLRDVHGRVDEWLREQSAGSGRLVAITHAEVIRSVVVSALDAPLAAFWRIDVAPLAVTELHAHDGRWTLVRVNCAGRRPR